MTSRSNKSLYPKTHLVDVLGNSEKTWDNLVTDKISFGDASFESSPSHANNEIIISGSLIPKSDNTYNLGNNSFKWKDLYLSPNSLKFENFSISSTEISIDIDGPLLLEGITNAQEDILYPPDGTMIWNEDRKYIRTRRAAQWDHDHVVVTPRMVEISALIVAGGGGGGNNQYFGGGGGAGGMLQVSSQDLEAGITYTVEIGAGGSPDSNGGDTVAFGYTATGGGRGGKNSSTSTSSSGSSTAGATGGSGGGGGSAYYTSQVGAGGAGIAGQGKNGAPGYRYVSSYYMSGGGGGAGQNSPNSSSTTALGGNGLAWIDGVTYAGGGGGTIRRNALFYSTIYTTGGSGGGGQGLYTSQSGGRGTTAGAANKGGGGGAPSAGGSGVVKLVIDDTENFTVSSGLVYTENTTTFASTNKRIITFTSGVGTFLIN